MLKEYLGDNTTKYTLTSGSELTLTNDELEELIENSSLVKDLKDQIEDLESDVSYLQREVDDNEEEIDSLNKEICKLEKQILFLCCIESTGEL